MPKRNLFLYGAVMAALLIIFTACQSTSPPEEQLSQENKKPGLYFPLTKGSSWKYAGEGNEYAPFTREVIFTDNNMAQIKEDNSGTQIAAVYQVTDDAVIRVLLKGDAYEDMNYLNNKFEENTVILKAPLETGTSWQIEEAQAEIVETKAKVEVPAGEYDNCLKVKTSFTDSTLYEYYKEGIGLVKREFVSGDSTVVSELEEVTIK